ncbi:MAG: 1,4-dihydroxy-6-naphtoate synthase [Planctomycetota bacterium]|nr:MAG: 1,4-dihydroxy-6-naphtoate synthase [Planctomycetota bacterium]
MTRLRVGLSTCPNDTFLFAPLLQGRVDTGALELDFVLGDVQELNEALRADELPVSKASFALSLELADTHGVLPVGAALGFGVGPVLLGAPGSAPPGPGDRLLAPGADTTASLLLRCLRPELGPPEQLRFDEIMPALLAGQAVAGVCIHEGRFTYAEQGLTLLEDLGASWEAATGCPVPLGGLLARHDLGSETHRQLSSVLRASLAAARAAPALCLPTMREHAQELSDEVLWRHVELYVNAHTAELGHVGERALRELASRAGAPSAPRPLPASTPPSP